MEDKIKHDHTALWDRLQEMDKHIQICEIERVRMQSDIDDLKSQREKSSMWQMRLVGVFAAIIMTITGAGINMYSKIESQQIQITRLDWDMDKALTFIAEWPTGRLGKLPDDNVQNTKINVLEEKVVELQGQVNKLYNLLRDALIKIGVLEGSDG